MVVDVKLCKEEGKPFGFRLIGGADFEIPLTCSKVSVNDENGIKNAVVNNATLIASRSGMEMEKLARINYAKVHF